MPGLPEMLVILLIVLLIFGAGKLPQIGDALGRSIRNFKRSASGGDELEVGKRKEVERIAERDRDEDEADVVSAKREKSKS